MSKLKKMNTPIFWAEGHPGKLDRENWKVSVEGLCDKPVTLSWQDLMNMQKTIADARLTSVTRFSVGGNWGGVKISDIAEHVKIKPEAKYVRFWSVGMVYDTSIPLQTAFKDKTLLAWEFDGELLEEDYGGPVRIICPYLWGYKSAKSVVKIIFTSRYERGYWEKRGYTDDAFIEAGPVIDINSGGKMKKIPDGEVTRFIDEE